MRSTNRCFDSNEYVVCFSLLKLLSKRKKQKKKKAVQSRRTRRKAKRKRNKSRRVAGLQSNSAKPPYLPCHYAVSFWLGGALGCPSYLCGVFVYFLDNFFQQLKLGKGAKNIGWEK